MSRVVPFSRYHMATIKLRGMPVESNVLPELSTGVLAALEGQSSWTLLDEQGLPVACGGIIELWPQRFNCWAYMTRDSGKYMVPITKAALRIIRGAGTGRFEMDVMLDFGPGQRWAKALGFSVETPLKKRFGPDGEDFVGYVRFQE